MSKTINELNLIAVLLKEKYPKATILNPDYHKSSDIDSTLHSYLLTMITETGVQFEIRLNTNFIPFGGADYNMNVTVTKDNRVMMDRKKELTRYEVNVNGMLNFLNELGLKI